MWHKMNKDFNKWVEFKKALHFRKNPVFANPRDIWWCSIGANVGAEIDGKNDSFERPAIVMKVYNRETLLILPLG